MATSCRARWALFVLLGSVLTVTLQLISGFLLAMGDTSIYAFHIADGLTAACFLAGEWVWLLSSTPGRQTAARIFLLSVESRHQLHRQLNRESGASKALRDGLDAPVEGLFLIFASITACIGILLWQNHGGLLPWHRTIAEILLFLWLLHLVFSIHDHWPRRVRRTEEQP
ncbi:MAG: hypothetical protein ACYCYL_06150 [Acidithiobacillus sp.]